MASILKQTGAILEVSSGVVYLPSATAHRLQVDEVMELAMGAPGGMAQKNPRDVQYTTGIADSLADALDALLSMLESEGRQDVKIFKDCEKVSNTYWGVK